VIKRHQFKLMVYSYRRHNVSCTKYDSGTSLVSDQNNIISSKPQKKFKGKNISNIQVYDKKNYT